MRQVTVSTVISAPREQIYDMVADLSRRPAFCDHFMTQYRLARANPVGAGAAARFRYERGLRSEWAELSIKEADRPRRIVEEGRIGRLGRSRTVSVYDFIPEPGNMTRVELTTFSEPKTFVDRIKQGGQHRWMRRKLKRALDRLRKLFEEPGKEAPAQVAIAGWDGYKAPRFGAAPTAEAGAAGSDG